MSSWTKLNPTVKFINTKKKFFNEFLHKIVINAPGCRIVHDTNDAATEIMYRLSSTLWANNHYLNRWKSANPDLLQYLIDVKKSFGNQIKIRVEDPLISIYSTDINTLYTIANNNWPTTIIEVHTPKNPEAISSLENGFIIGKIAKEFQYKLMFKELYRISYEEKLQIKNYIYNLGDDVKISAGFKKYFNSSNQYLPNGYVYAKNENIATMMNLIYPGLIYKIYKITEEGL